MFARANDVIDHYLNGPGSYWDSGPRKPLHETVNDLQDFKNRIVASKQFADDPNLIMDSMAELVDRTAKQVEQVAQNNEGRDNIRPPAPDTDDPIEDPRVISPRSPNNSALSISTPLEGVPLAQPQIDGTLGGSNGTPVRYLGRRIAGQPQVFDMGAPAVPFAPSLAPLLPDDARRGLDSDDPR